jgi:hypothetical protein
MITTSDDQRTARRQPTSNLSPYADLHVRSYADIPPSARLAPRVGPGSSTLPWHARRITPESCAYDYPTGTASCQIMAIPQARPRQPVARLRRVCAMAIAPVP